MANSLNVKPSHHASLPNCSYAVPQLPQAKATTTDITLPVIDLSSGSRGELSRALLDAGKEFGFFQIINHGIPERVLQDVVSASEEFFQLPAADQAHFSTEDRNRPNRLFWGSTYKTNYWMHCLRLVRTSFAPGDDCKKDWPQKPEEFRDAFENYTTLMRGLVLELLHMLSEGLGLPCDYFDGDQAGGDMILGLNRYPPCPNPDVAFGLPPHCDRNLITLVLPSPVPGLQVFYKGDWIMVAPIPNSFVVNFGVHLEVVTNGILKSVEHRVITNPVQPRMSVVTTIHGTQDCLVGPAGDLLSDNNPPRYRTHTLRDFMRIYTKSLESNPDAALEEHMKPFMI